MKHVNKYYILPAIALVLLGTVLGLQLDSYLTDGDTIQQLKKLEKAFVIINRKYVDPVESKAIAEEGITGMLKELDPHSSYITAEQVADVRENYRGSFGGIGIMFEVVKDTARVISPIADGPSDQAGIMAGDRIIAIEDSSAVGITSEGVQDRLKGPIGSKVTLTVIRPSVDETHTYTIKRDEIPLYSIDSSYMIDDKTGYIKIDRFAMTTYDEFMDHVGRLKGEGMERLLLDLRFNPGGVMKSAIEIADEMLTAGQTIVQTKGRDASMNNQYRGSNGGIFENQPVIVLINRRSASASEIVAGALQDHDRALLVGERTFGKALVQKQFELDDGSLLQMTVGRYYTPVGRLIQTPYNSGDLEDYYEQKFASYDKATFHAAEYKDSIPDSLKYTTDHGRTVFGGGGILPDYIVQPDTAGLTRYVAASGLDFAFVRDWFLEHEKELRDTWSDRQEAFRKEYAVADETVDAFWTFAEEKGIELTTDTAAVNRPEGVFPMEEKTGGYEFMQARIKGYLARQLFGSRAARPIFNEVDPVFKEALSLWDQAQNLAAYGNGDGMPSNGANGSGTSMNDGR